MASTRCNLALLILNSLLSAWLWGRRIITARALVECPFCMIRSPYT